ncbi:MAG: glycerol-3-phosphate dehydrogenase/oxidase [Gammaproteobacteria bacterium]|nr:glycerol-3-phosphate dehydrogenase/oxidase [Gammaproteobacteria bacterium]
MQRDINKLSAQPFDLLVCGGGIYGAWVAYDAALRGLSVAIVDKGDWAGGTSSASSKLIHGGLRYLETFDFALVKKSLIERQMLLHTAPHRVWPLRFGIPIYKNNRLGSFKINIGLALYDFLAGKTPESQRRQSLTKDELLQHFPHLKPAELLSGFTYFDAQCDDARFVLELIYGAYLSGAACANYCAVIEFIEPSGVVAGAVLQDRLTGESFTVSAKQVVDTTGRWSQTCRRRQNGARLTKGVHLVMPNVLINEALLLTAQADGRIFFMIPWYGRTLLGTTDTDFNGDIDHVTVTDSDIQYLLTETNRVLAEVNWSERDIIGHFAGIRVLQESDKSNPSQLSRDWLLMQEPNGLIVSIGGKLTSAREDASRIVDCVCTRLDIKTPSQTVGRPLPWLMDINYRQLLDDAEKTGRQLGIHPTDTEILVKRHGQRVNDLFTLCRANLSLTQRIIPDLPFILADLVFCAQQEMVIHLDDLLRRRVPLLILAKLTEAELIRLAQLAGQALGWDRQRIGEEIEHCRIK